MSDEQTPPSDFEVQARRLGWAPQEEFRGDASKWVDAETFVKRGQEQLPLLQANNKRLQSNVTQLAGELTQLRELFEASQESLTELKKFHDESFTARIDAEKARIRAEIRSAREDGDIESEEAARERLSGLQAEEREITKTAKVAAPAPSAPKPQALPDTPEFTAWKDANSEWFDVDQTKMGVAFGLAQVIRANTKLVGKPFYDALDKELEKVYGTARPVSKVEGARGGGGEGSGAPGTVKGYSSLPADAKEVCTKQAKSFVGPGRAFKTTEEWQKHYAKVYFEREA